MEKTVEYFQKQDRIAVKKQVLWDPVAGPEKGLEKNVKKSVKAKLILCINFFTHSS